MRRKMCGARVAKVKRKLIRDTRQEMEKLYEDFGDKMAEAMEAKIAGDGRS